MICCRAETRQISRTGPNDKVKCIVCLGIYVKCLPGPNDKEVKMGSQVEWSTYLYSGRLSEGEMLLEDRKE